MAIIKCKMCGGDMELTADKTFGTCEYCGSTMTLPKVDNDQRVAAFNRGNHFRRIGEFDKALSVYESIVREDDTDAEAHWCCALCRFGIEYVEDPVTYEWIPTCHRASFDSFLEDVDYLAAVEHSDGITKRQYQKDATKIAEVQKAILSTSQSEEPYDVFICYKESDDNGNRTKDSTLAQDIYYQLTEQGRRVFFARITLEDVVGKQYEPYIFAALNSAKIMIVVGTRAEHLNAVWVKNEWSRFLIMMKKDRSKLLLPCYRDMDPYDMPEQLSVLQSYDMSKIGFIQDLTRGIAKVLDAGKKSEAKETVLVQQSGGPGVESLLRRGQLFLEDRDWKSANEYFDKVLDINPECSDAYVGKLCAEMQYTNIAQLAGDASLKAEKSGNLAKALRFGNSELQAKLQEYMEAASRKRFEQNREAMYRETCTAMDKAHKSGDFYAAAEKFEKMSGYQEADAKKELCLQRAETARKREEAQVEEQRRREEEKTAAAYEAAVKMKDSAVTPKEFAEAAKAFERLHAYRDCEKQVRECRVMEQVAQKKEEAAAEQRRVEKELQRIAQEEAATELKKQKRKKRRKTVLAVILILIVLAISVPVAFYFVVGNMIYKEAETALEAGNYELAIEDFTTLADGLNGGFKDSPERLVETKLAKAQAAWLEMDRDTAWEIWFDMLTGSDPELTERVTEFWYQQVEQYTSQGEYDMAIAMLEEMEGFTPVEERMAEVERMMGEEFYAQAEALLTAGGNPVEAAQLFGSVADYKDARDRSRALWNGFVEHKSIDGYLDTVGVKSDGTVLMTYDTDISELENQNIVSVGQGDGTTVGLTADGKVVGFGEFFGPARSWSDIMQISVHRFDIVGLKMDGTVESNTCDLNKWKGIVSVDVGEGGIAGVQTDGSVILKDLKGVDVSDWENIISVCVGDSHVVGLKADGTVIADGENDNGECDVREWTDIVAIDAGMHHTVGLKADGTVVVTGLVSNGAGDTQDWSDIVAIAAGNYHTIGLKANGTAVATGSNDHDQCNVSSWSGLQVPEN